MGIPRFGSEPYLVRIGNHVTVSSDVHFITHDGATWVFRHREQFRGLQRFGRIDIEDNCFIGAGAFLMPNIRIGPNSVVGAASVVTKSVPPNTVVAGSPARCICSYEEFVERSVPRCTRYGSEVTGDKVRLRAALMAQFPYQPVGDASEPGSSDNEVVLPEGAV
jgi:NDP-sugar pyrophosphorylase family protein